MTRLIRWETKCLSKAAKPGRRGEQGACGVPGAGLRWSGPPTPRRQYGLALNLSARAGLDGNGCLPAGAKAMAAEPGKAL